MEVSLWLAAVVIGWVIGWVVLNIIGWLRTRSGPFNWRILVGADLYYRWLDRR
jgi:hypothetical protein